VIFGTYEFPNIFKNRQIFQKLPKFQKIATIYKSRQILKNRQNSEKSPYNLKSSKLPAMRFAQLGPPNPGLDIYFNISFLSPFYTIVMSKSYFLGASKDNFDYYKSITQKWSLSHCTVVR